MSYVTLVFTKDTKDRKSFSPLKSPNDVSNNECLRIIVSRDAVDATFMGLPQVEPTVFYKMLINPTLLSKMSRIHRPNEMNELYSYFSDNFIFGIQILSCVMLRYLIPVVLAFHLINSLFHS